MSALDELAQRAGIEESYANATGETIRASSETRQKLLTAMDIACANEAEIAASLEAFDHADWGRALPPVRIACSEAGPLTIELVLPAGTGRVTWQVALEAGGSCAGEADFAALEQIGERSLDGQPLARRILVLGAEIAHGYHRLTITPGDAATTLIVVPAQCWLPAEKKLWGVTTQLYLLRSRANWGIGDFSDLRHLVSLVAPRGADVIGLNPLHAMFLDHPEQASPYSPASRLLLNVLNIDVSAIPELAGCEPARELIASPEFRRQMEICRGAALVDYAGVAELKLRVLALLYKSCPPGADTPRGKAFAEFRSQGGRMLQRSCVFQALREHMARRDPDSAAWQLWPAELHDPDGPAVAEFATQHADRITFRAWLQFLADTQLGDAAAAARDAGMAIGLYRDLAVGADRGGAETWSNPHAVVSGAQVGAPPDIYNPAGQDWGLPPFNPRALREEAYRSFIDLVRANMRHAGGLRIDHVMALQHLYWVPQGSSPADGAYVGYDLEDLVGILALESSRQKCLIVGEDLGTVPTGFRERMEAANILSYRVLFFEKDEAGNYLPPDAYPALSLSVAGSHDLPTLRGWWEGTDIGLKQSLGLYPREDEAARQDAARIADRKALLLAFERENLLVPGEKMDVDALVHAAHAFLARGTAMLAMAQIDDITDEADPVNVPATSDEHPNWRRRISVDLEMLDAGSRLAETCEIFQTTRAKPRRDVTGNSI